MSEQPKYNSDIDLHKLYKDTGNPMFVWLERSCCRKQHIPVPEWVEQYLDTAGMDLINADPLPREVPQTIANALEFTGKGGPNAYQFIKQMQRTKMIETIDYMQASVPEASIKAICREISRHIDIPWSTIERWYQRR